MTVVDIGRQAKLKNIINNMTLSECNIRSSELRTVGNGTSFVLDDFDHETTYEVRYGSHFAEYNFSEDLDAFIGLLYLDEGIVHHIEYHSLYGIIEQIANHILDSEEKK